MDKSSPRVDMARRSPPSAKPDAPSLGSKAPPLRKKKAAATAGGTDVAATKAKTRGALLGGLRSGALEAAVSKMEADTAPAPAPAPPPPAAPAPAPRSGSSATPPPLSGARRGSGRSSSGGGSSLSQKRRELMALRQSVQATQFDM